MRFSLFCSALVLTLFATESIAAAPIVGGDEVPRYSDVPFMVQFTDYRDRVRCAGVIIHPLWVLTAGHCQGAYAQSELYAGTLGVGISSEHALKLKSAKSYRHPGYKENYLFIHDDFLLIRLKRPIDFTRSDLKPVTLPDEDFLRRGLEDEGAIATVFGWGLEDEDGKDGARKLRKASLPIVSRSALEASYPKWSDDTMLGAGFPQGGKDACSGDSGGPLLVYDPVKKTQVLVGLVSWGEGCGRAKYYGVYAKVSAALSWIQDTIRENP